MPVRSKDHSASLFEPENARTEAKKWRSEPPPGHVIAHIDGGARGNPGPAGYGVVIHDDAGKKLAALSSYLGHRTNNFAEYSGLIAALDFALAGGYRALRVVSDSLLLVQQMRGVYKVKNLDLRDFHSRAQALVEKLDWFAVEHVLRGHNREADRLANAAMDAGSAGSLREEGGPAEELQQEAVRSKVERARDADPASDLSKEFSGVVRGGVVELVRAKLPDGTKVKIRVAK